MNTTNEVPKNAFVHIPDNWKQAHATIDRNFRVIQSFTDGQNTLTEAEMLRKGIACYRVQIDKFTVRDYPA